MQFLFNNIEKFTLNLKSWVGMVALGRQKQED